MASRFEGHTPNIRASASLVLEDGPDGPELVAECLGPRMMENAALFAAAPDLLAENERLREALLMILEQCQKNGQEWDSKLRAARAFRAQIRAALEGGESEIERRERVLRQAAKKQWEEERKERARGDRP